MNNIKLTTLFLILNLSLSAFAQDAATPTDSAKSSEKKGFIGEIISYFDDSNKDKKHKKFDISFIGGPHYSSDTKFGIGLVGSGLYRLNGCDSIMQPSNVSIFGDVSTVGFFLLGVSNTTFFPDDKFRLNTKMSFYSFPTYFWGIGYDNNDNDDNKSKYKRFQSQIMAEFLWSPFKNTFVGPKFQWNYIHGREFERIELIEGQDRTTRNYGLGISLKYDSRDCITSAHSGYCLSIEQMFRPGWMGNKYHFNSTEIEFSTYKELWKDAVIAGQVAAAFNYGNPSWGMLASLGGSKLMRGYYEGRYRDNNSLAAQVELRQRVWKRSGLVVWGGAGSVFHNSDTFKKWLPNYGIGYRWEFKKRVNVRVDYGFGKSGQNGFIFNVNEAF